MFFPEVGQELVIDGESYRIEPHPRIPYLPFGQEGRQSTVYKLSSPGGQGFALKVFKYRYRKPYLSTLAQQLQQFSTIPGMEACRRKVLTPSKNLDLIRDDPDLAYATLMPWIEGNPWIEVLSFRKPMIADIALAIAIDFARLMTELEEKGISHGDISSSNLIIGGTAGEPSAHLVDFEQIYMPGFEKPENIPSPPLGYSKAGSEPNWGPFTDRLSGAIIISEILGFSDERIANKAWGESFFDPEEVGTDCDRYLLLGEVLKQNYGGRVSDLFWSAWNAATEADCPLFADWLIELTKCAENLGLERPFRIFSRVGPASGGVLPEQGVMAPGPSSTGGSAPGETALSGRDPMPARERPPIDDVHAAEVAPLSYTVTASASEHGAIWPSGSLRAEHGSELTFTIAPDQGYRVSDLLLDGESLGPLTSYTLAGIQSDHRIEVSFAPLSYTVTASASEHGAIWPSGSLRAEHGSELTFTIAPDQGYRVSDLLLDGESLGPLTSYTLGPVHRDHRLEAFFERILQQGVGIQQAGITGRPFGEMGTPEGMRGGGGGGEGPRSQYPTLYRRLPGAEGNR